MDNLALTPITTIHGETLDTYIITGISTALPYVTATETPPLDAEVYTLEAMKKATVTSPAQSPSLADFLASQKRKT